MVAHIQSIAFEGIEAQEVDIQVQISNGLPAFTIVGLPDKAVAESRERIRSALHALGLSLPPKRITINLAPADLMKEGSHYDLPIALGLLCAMNIIPQDALEQFVALGELGLDGTLRPSGGILPAAIHAMMRNCNIICAAPCANEARWAGDLDVLAPQDLLQLINHFKGSQILNTQHDVEMPVPSNANVVNDNNVPDLRDIRGQESAKRALLISAAGGHNLLMVGAPGSGKSMLASALCNILPALSPNETLETSIIHSISGTLPQGGIVSQRPYRAPHHSATLPALIGGGQKARPGEMSLAHNGVLFLDELPEFSRNTLEALRQPLETKEVVIARANHHVKYPAKAQLIAAMNPCRCGHLGSGDLECSKAPKCGEDYQSKISGPLLDRFDLHIHVPPVKVSDLQLPKSGMTSSEAKDIVETTRLIQLERNNNKTNAELSPSDLETIIALDEDAQTLIRQAGQSQHLSARGYHRVLRCARTIADLELVQNQKKTLTAAPSDTPLNVSHVAEALSYRKLRLI